ncbi:MAG: hypothetical protein D6B27_07600 [Gammaproteobacteria bacterium]|nr:MAG: hypothetical protein D6B27_07600 [Gammaproteobacteria bacterium]
MTNRSKALILLLSFFVIVIIFIADCFLTRKEELRDAVRFLLKQELNLEFSIHEELLDMGADSSGEWWVKLNSKSNSLPVALSRLTTFGEADKADIGYYKTVIIDSFQVNAKDLNGYKLQRGEIIIQNNLVCSEESPCNVFIMYKPENENLFVGILKI